MLKNIQIETCFEGTNGIMTTKELKAKGVNHYFIRKLIKNGQIEPIKRGIYKLANTDVNEFSEVLGIVPKGVFCLYSAASLHNLSTFIPTEYHITIPKKNKVTLTDYPPIHLYYWDKTLYTLGVEQLKKDGDQIATYDLEKTVCDFIKFRNKLGFDIAKEVLKNYLNRKDRNIDKLTKYAKKLRIYSVINPYLKILL